MSVSSLDLDAYLERISYDGPLAPSAETLRRLHRAQVLSIPFENLDLFLGRSIQLDEAGLMKKLVEERRGGYCYELNGLFLLVLQRLGFAVTPLAARVFHDETPAQKSHQLTLVEVEGKRWLADVGFGGNGLLDPLPLEPEQAVRQEFDTFRLHSDPKLGYITQFRVEESWHSLHAFTLEEYYPADYRMMNHYNSTSPTALFTQHIVCTQATSLTRFTLFDDELKARNQDETTVTHLTSKEAYRSALQEVFGIVLPPGSELRSPFSAFHMVL
jgi:N-hydroxyarylamine O-acetyltransferase